MIAAKTLGPLGRSWLFSSPGSWRRRVRRGDGAQRVRVIAVVIGPGLRASVVAGALVSGMNVLANVFVMMFAAGATGGRRGGRKDDGEPTQPLLAEEKDLG